MLGVLLLAGPVGVDGGSASASEPQVGLPPLRFVGSPWSGGRSAWRSLHSSAVKRQSFLFFQNLNGMLALSAISRIQEADQQVFVFGITLVSAPSCGVAALCRR